MAGRIAIRAEGLTKVLGGRRVLRQINLVIAEGACVVLRGGNGSGKTTLLRCLAGLLRPDSGQILWRGHSPEELLARSLVGFLAHENHLYPNLTLIENLVLAGRLQGLTDVTSRAQSLLDRAGLSVHAGRLPREVSQGTRRRAAIARTLMHNPPLLLLDEPTAGLDDAGQRWVADCIRERRDQGLTCCLATHESFLPTSTIDRQIRISAGRLEGEPPTTTHRADLDVITTEMAAEGVSA